MHTNLVVVSKQDHDLLLSKFPAKFHDKLRLYTGEELFYTYKLCTFRPEKDSKGDYKSGDILLLALKAKTFRWLQGIEKYGVHPNAWVKLSYKFRAGFRVFADMESIAA